MNAIPRGKIGRLSPELREQVNRRMERHEPAARLTTWLNALPEVQALLAAEFKGKPITEQNLSLWRKFGFRDWLLHRQAQTMAAEMGHISSADSSSLTARLAVWGTFRYQMAVRQLVNSPSGGLSHVNTLRNFANDLIALRRADQRAALLHNKQEQGKNQPYDQ